MAITNDQYNRVLARLTKIEIMLNDLAVAVDKFVTADQVTQLNTLLQTEVADLRLTVVALENRVQDIEEEPLL
jgi:polyhydroxyalkanoate synthesis regulator phasin